MSLSGAFVAPPTREASSGLPLPQSREDAADFASRNDERNAFPFYQSAPPGAMGGGPAHLNVQGIGFGRATAGAQFMGAKPETFERFNFRRRSKRVDWRTLAAVDPERLVLQQARRE